MRIYFLAVALASIFLGWNIPNHYPPFPSFHHEILAAIGVVLAVIALCPWPWSQTPIASGAPASVKMATPKAAFAWAALALVPPIQWSFGHIEFRADAALGALYVLGASSAICVGAVWATQAGRERTLGLLFATIALGAIAANGFALAQWFRLPAAGWWAMELIDNRPYGNLAQANHFGLLMVLGWVSIAALFELRLIRSVTVLALAVAYLGWGILISQSRASALAVVVIVVLWALTRREVSTRLRPWPVFVAFACWIACFLLFDRIQEAVTPFDTVLRNRLDGGVRPAMWRHFATAIAAHPWIGYGFNQGVAAMAEVATLLPPSETRSTVYAHNFILDLGVWGGVPLAALLSASLLGWMWGWVRRSGDAVWRQHRIIACAVWLALLTQSLLEYPYAYAYFLLPCCLVAGAISAPNCLPLQARVRPAASVWWIWGLAFVLLTALVRDYVYLEEDFRQARFARANYQDRPAHVFLDHPLVLDLLAVNNSSALRKAAPGMPPEQLENMRRLARRIQNPAIQIDYAKALALNGKPAQAQHELDILRSLYSPEVFASIDKEWQAWKIENLPSPPVP